MLRKVCDRALLPKKLTLRPVETAGGSGTRVDITRAPRAVCRRLPDGGKRHSRLGPSRSFISSDDNIVGRLPARHAHF